MTAFLPKQQLQLQEPTVGKVALDNRVDSLGKDLMSLFGQTTQTMETYNTIGANTAKIQASEDINKANLALSDVKVNLVKAQAANDTESIRKSQQDMENITSGLVANSSKFSSHDAAFEAYNNATTEFSTNIRSAWNPMIEGQFISAAKTNQEASNKLTNEMSSKNGIHITDASVELQDSTSSLLGIPTSQTASDAFNTNHFQATAVINKNISEVVDKYKLFKTDDKTGETSYDFLMESKMVSEMYGDRYFVDVETGQVMSISKYATAEEIAKISGMLGGMREGLVDGMGNVKNPAFDALMQEAKSVVTAFGTNTADVYKNRQVKELLEIPLTSMSKGQRYERTVFLANIKVNDDIRQDIAGKVDNLIATSDATGLILAQSNGYGGASGAQVKAEVSRRGQNLNAAVNSAILSGNQSVGDIYEQALKQSFVLGTTLDATTQASNIISGATQAVSTNQYQSALLIERGKLNVGNLAGTGYSSSIEVEFRKSTLATKSQQIESKRQELV